MSNDFSAKYKPLYTGRAKKTIAWKDYRGVDWPQTDWFPDVGPCELLINKIKPNFTLKAVLTVLCNYFAKDPAKKFYFLQEELLGGERVRDYEYSVQNLTQLEQSELYSSSFTSVL